MSYLSVGGSSDFIEMAGRRVYLPNPNLKILSARTWTASAYSSCTTDGVSNFYSVPTGKKFTMMGVQYLATHPSSLSGVALFSSTAGVINGAAPAGISAGILFALGFTINNFIPKEIALNIVFSAGQFITLHNSGYTFSATCIGFEEDA